MTEKDINKQLNDEYDKFLFLEPYNGKEEIPEDILDLFKKAIMAMPPFAHKINFLKVKSIASKKLSELTNDDLNNIIKVILNTPLERFYEEFNYAVKEYIKIEKFVLHYNQMVEEFSKSLTLKKERLKKLSNIGFPSNGLKIVPQGQA